MTNDAAKRLRNRLMAFTVDTDQWAIDAALLESALAAERRATVERIRERLAGSDKDYISRRSVVAILDEEAAR